VIEEYRPDLFGIHMGKGTIAGIHVDRLIPIPFSREKLQEVIYATNKLQDCLGKQVLLENISQYFTQPESEMSCAEFLIKTAQAAKCGVILDVTNMIVNRGNFAQSESGLDELLEMGIVAEVHIAGYSTGGGSLIDSHDCDFPADCEVLLREVLRRCGPVVVTLERDANIHRGGAILQEVRRLRRILSEIVSAVG
jgi:uncharacterized protein (UPF0276 family)